MQQWYIKFVQKPHIFFNKNSNLRGAASLTSLAGRIHPHRTDTFESLMSYGHDSDENPSLLFAWPLKWTLYMSQIKNSESILITAGGKITCRRCKARSSRTKLQCSKPALKGKAVCGHHGGYSTGPKTSAGKDRIRAAHWKDGSETIEAKAERKKKFAELNELAISLGINPRKWTKRLW